MVQPISPQEVHNKLHSNKDIIVIDVLPNKYFKKQHIPQAINIPTDNITEEASHFLDKKRTIIVYCYDKDCQASPKAAQILEDNGYENIYDLEEGIEGYKQAGFNIITYD